ncbi:MAG TPA: NmrA family NAD(P)-binding protein [Solirubrobacteraceae bacterium]
MRILVTGASGFAGSLLVPRLLCAGHDVRALGRDPARVSAALATSATYSASSSSSSSSASSATARDDAAELSTEVEILRGDALTGVGLAAALAGVDVAYYLIHSMERPAGDSVPFDERDRIAARNFADAAAHAGVARIVYLGGLLPRKGAASRHLASRDEVECILLAAVPDSLALRASIVIGARSRSFRFLVHLVERLPVLTLPAWRSFRTAPIDERDVVEMLAAAATLPAVLADRSAVAGRSQIAGRGPITGRSSTTEHAPSAERSFDIGGPDVLTYGEMISRIAELMLVRRPVLGFGINVTPVAARVAAAIASEDPDLILPLMESLHGDLLPRDSTTAELFDVRLHSFDAAVEHALRAWEESEPLSAR